MLDTYTQTLIESVAETLETMAFIMAMPAEEDLEAPCATVQVSMSFEGPVNGTIAIMGGNELVELIAANFLGLEPEDKDVHEKKIDAFKELLNTICGILLPKFATVDSDVFNITIPESIEYDEIADWDNFVAQEHIAILDCDYYPLAISITTTE